ncbi:hypothetical protein AA313_de0207134 [Arthrobotrys entomopaga]|nr:hypothetical protein AA313_de0207134 [Arthrobotrys entomopaga]
MAGISSLPSELQIQILSHLDLLDPVTHITIPQVCTFWRDLFLSETWIKKCRYNLFRSSFPYDEIPDRKAALHFLFNTYQPIKCTIRNREIAKYSITTDPYPLAPFDETRWKNPMPERIEDEIPLDSIILNDSCFGDDGVVEALRPPPEEEAQWMSEQDADGVWLEWECINYVVRVYHGMQHYTVFMSGSLNGVGTTFKVKHTLEYLAEVTGDVMSERGYDVGKDHYLEMMIYPRSFGGLAEFMVTVFHPDAGMANV